MSDIKRVVLAYSGGLDTSVILKWLQVTYNCEVVTFTADLGQGEELGPARQGRTDGREGRAHLHRRPARGIRARFRVPDDARQRPLRRRLPARHLDRAAADFQAPDRDRQETGADAVAHGATGKGNDQVRFELSAYALDPSIKVIAPGANGTSPAAPR
jgi:argininosuccinate synthase